MKRSNSIIIAGAAALAGFALFWLWPQSPRKITLPGPISTVTAGYPFALQIKNQMDRTANLTSVIIDLDRRGEEFHVPQILYGFSSPKPNGRVFAVAVDNAKKEASWLLDAPKSPDSPFMSPRTRAALDLSAVAKDISAVLEIAKTNGLSEFCTLAPTPHGTVDLRLFNNSSGNPLWGVIGDGWDEKGPIADLALVIDAHTGAVLRHTLTKAENRP